MKKSLITPLNSPGDSFELKYSPNQPRDSRGRWSSTGGGGGGLEGSTAVGNATVAKVQDHLTKMFNDPSPSSWGGAGFIQATIRTKFQLTHQQAKDIHRDWAAKKEKAGKANQRT